MAKSTKKPTAKKAAPKSATPKKPSGKSTDELPMDQLDKVSGGVFRSPIRAKFGASSPSCSTGVLSTCKVTKSQVDSMCD